MDEELLLEALKKQSKEKLIYLLLCSFDVLDDAKRLQVFNEIYYKEQTPVFNPQKIYTSVKTFYNDSKAKNITIFYQPVLRVAQRCLKKLKFGLKCLQICSR